MSSQLLFYDQARPVNPTEHRDLCVKAGNDYGFAHRANMVPLMATEFLPAASEYAIVFGGDDDQCIGARVRDGSAEPFEAGFDQFEIRGVGAVGTSGDARRVAAGAREDQRHGTSPVVMA